MVDGRLSLTLAGGLRPPDPPPGGSAPLDPRSMAWVHPVFEKYTFFDVFSLRALKSVAIHEKQVFTFFAFLPPLISAFQAFSYMSNDRA